mmetsp:Transcript_4266/g.9978  ORF Transcript_4266/g.9978 Transcript_4266/m.9978 type:complete len:109 (+) Transcript_4266:205-531(+)
MFSRLQRWCTKPWRSVMVPLGNTLLTESDKQRKMAVFEEACSILRQYENVESISTLEMALWKMEFKRGWNNDGKRQALDRGECRCVCGSNIVIPSVAMFLGIPTTLSS